MCCLRGNVVNIIMCCWWQLAYCSCFICTPVSGEFALILLKVDGLNNWHCCCCYAGAFSEVWTENGVSVCLFLGTLIDETYVGSSARRTIYLIKWSYPELYEWLYRDFASPFATCLYVFILYISPIDSFGRVLCSIAEGKCYIYELKSACLLCHYTHIKWDMIKRRPRYMLNHSYNELLSRRSGENILLL